MSKYDVFISFKNTDSRGKNTRDFYMAKELYEALTRHHIRVFFSPETLRENAVSNYAEFIDNAIEESDILIAVGSLAEHFKSKWVFYELDSFRNELLSGRKDETRAGMISYISRDVRVEKLPLFLRKCEVFYELEKIVEWVSRRKKFSGQVAARFVPQEPPAPAADFSPGSYLLEHYQILQLIGRGGMSSVYLAMDELRKKPVAVKVTNNRGVMDFESMKEAVRAEAAILMRLNHPCFPRIYDVIEKPEMVVMIMDYIEGHTLREVIHEKGAMKEEQVIHIGRQLCEVLQYLHQMDPPVIYRDLKPGNIILRPDKNIMLLDFGTAREYKPRNLSDTTCLGTRGYAAPEQYGGMGQTDARTDIYGLGVTLYHLATKMDPAMPPYEIKPIREIVPALSRQLEFIIGKATRSDPDERYQSAEEMLYYLNNPKKVKLPHESIFLSLFNRRNKQNRGKPIPSDSAGSAPRVPVSVPVVPSPRETVTIPIAPPEVMGSHKMTAPIPYEGPKTHELTEPMFDDAPATQELTPEEKEMTARNLFVNMAETAQINSTTAVCFSIPDKVSVEAEDSVYLYFFTTYSADKVKKRIVSSGLGANVKTEKLVLIPKDSIVSVSLRSDDVRFNKPMVRFLWDGTLCFSRIRIEKLLSDKQVIPVTATIAVDGKELKAVSFELSR